MRYPRKMTTFSIPSTRFRPHSGTAGKSRITTPPRAVGSRKNKNTEKAIPITIDKVMISPVSFSLPSFSSSHLSNLDGSSSPSPSSG